MSEVSQETPFGVNNCLIADLAQFLTTTIPVEDADEDEKWESFEVTEAQAVEIRELKLQDRRASMGQLVCDRTMCFVSCMAAVYLKRDEKTVEIRVSDLAGSNCHDNK
jgi:hypothetical protein